MWLRSNYGVLMAAAVWFASSDLLFGIISTEFRLRLFLSLNGKKSKVWEHSYLQPWSWLRSICDLLPWPQELAVIWTEGLEFPRSSSGFTHLQRAASWAHAVWHRLDKLAYPHDACTHTHVSWFVTANSQMETVLLLLSAEERDERWRCMFVTTGWPPTERLQQLATLLLV